MPRRVRRKGKRWEIYNADTGKVYGSSSSRKKAWASAKIAEGALFRWAKKRRKRT